MTEQVENLLQLNVGDVVTIKHADANYVLDNPSGVITSVQPSITGGCDVVTVKLLVDIADPDQLMLISRVGEGN